MATMREIVSWSLCTKCTKELNCKTKKTNKMSYFVEKVNIWRKAYGRQMSVVETVATYGCEWVVMCDDDPFLHIWRNACIMMGWDMNEIVSTAKEAWLRYNEVLDR